MQELKPEETPKVDVETRLESLEEKIAEIHALLKRAEPFLKFGEGWAKTRWPWKMK